MPEGFLILSHEEDPVTYTLRAKPLELKDQQNIAHEYPQDINHLMQGVLYPWNLPNCPGAMK